MDSSQPFADGNRRLYRLSRHHDHGISLSPEGIRLVRSISAWSRTIFSGMRLTDRGTASAQMRDGRPPSRNQGVNYPSLTLGDGKGRIASRQHAVDCWQSCSQPPIAQQRPPGRVLEVAHVDELRAS